MATRRQATTASPLGVKVSPDKFAAALDRIAGDPTFRKSLEERPASAIGELGFELGAEGRAAIGDKHLSEILPKRRKSGPGAGPVAQTYAYVAVGVVIMIGTKVNPGDEIEHVAHHGARKKSARAKKAKAKSRRRSG